MNKDEWIKCLKITLLVVCIGVTAYLLYLTRDEALYCKANPFQYGVDKIAQSRNANNICLVNPQTSSASCIVEGYPNAKIYTGKVAK